MENLSIELARIRRNVGRGATRDWLEWVVAACVTLADKWGGADVVTWWLAERTEPVHRVTGAARDRMVKMCGRSERSLKLIWKAHMRTFGDAPGSSTPRRMQHGWNHMDVTTHLSMMLAEHGV